MNTILLLVANAVAMCCVLTALGCSSALSPTQEGDPSDLSVCARIGKDIEALGNKYPQLADFDASRDVDVTLCHIQYEYKCHQPQRRGGWTSGVPNPDPDGIWFYIGIWDPHDPAEWDSQINTQPAGPVWYMGDRKVTFLILEGEDTEEVSAQLIEIMKKYGLRIGDD